MKGLTLNIDLFIQDLLKTTHLEKDEEMKKMLQEEVTQILLKAISMNMEPMLVNYLEHHFSQETSLDFMILQTIANSPRIQVDIITGLEKLRNELLEGAIINGE